MYATLSEENQGFTCIALQSQPVFVISFLVCIKSLPLSHPHIFPLYKKAPPRSRQCVTSLGITGQFYILSQFWEGPLATECRETQSNLCKQLLMKEKNLMINFCNKVYICIRSLSTFCFFCQPTRKRLACLFVYIYIYINSIENWKNIL